jgi:hypothetical protein
MTAKSRGMIQFLSQVLRPEAARRGMERLAGAIEAAR